MLVILEILLTLNSRRASDNAQEHLHLDASHQEAVVAGFSHDTNPTPRLNTVSGRGQGAKVVAHKTVRG